jgi:hypothetical protein
MQPTHSSHVHDYTTSVETLEHLFMSQPATAGRRIGMNTKGLQPLLLQALWQRDQVKAVQLIPDEIEAVRDLDHRLSALAARFKLDRHIWQGWRAVRHPNHEDWWWYLDVRPTDLMGSLSEWDVITVVTNVITISLGIEIIWRVLGGSNDLFVRGIVVAQVLITIRSLSFNNRLGVNESNPILGILGLTPSQFSMQRALFGSSLAILSAIVLWFGLPQMAFWLHERTDVNDASNIARSVQNLRLAASLDPLQPEAPFKLSLVLETAGQLDEAIATLRDASLKSNDVRIYQNLARLLIVRAEQGGIGARGDALRAHDLLGNVIVRQKCQPEPTDQNRLKISNDQLLFCYRVYVTRARGLMFLQATKRASQDLEIASKYYSKIDEQDVATGYAQPENSMVYQVMFGVEVRCLQYELSSKQPATTKKLRTGCENAITELRKIQTPQHYYPILTPRWLELLQK